MVSDNYLVMFNILCLLIVKLIIILLSGIWFVRDGSHNGRDMLDMIQFNLWLTAIQISNLWLAKK